MPCIADTVVVSVVKHIYIHTHIHTHTFAILRSEKKDVPCIADTVVVPLIEAQIHTDTHTHTPLQYLDLKRRLCRALQIQL